MLKLNDGFMNSCNPGTLLPRETVGNISPNIWNVEFFPPNTFANETTPDSPKSWKKADLFHLIFSVKPTPQCTVRVSFTENLLCFINQQQWAQHRLESANAIALGLFSILDVPCTDVWFTQVHSHIYASSGVVWPDVSGLQPQIVQLQIFLVHKTLVYLRREGEIWHST